MMRWIPLALIVVLVASCGKDNDDDDGNDGDSGGSSTADDGGTGTGDSSGPGSGSDDGGDSGGSSDEGTETSTGSGSDCAGEAAECGEGYPECCGDLQCTEIPDYPYGDLMLCAQEGGCVGPGSICTQLPCCEGECVDAGPTSICSG